MSTVFKRLWQRFYCGILAAGAVFALVLSPIAAHAEAYGCGTYSSDSYNSNCSSSTPSGSASSGSTSTSTPAAASAAAESTVIQTSSGLQVAINLSDGQAIPSTGYYITITPINGAGTSFDKAEIYLDGVLVFTGPPDSTGTLKWLWDTAKYPATKVKIIVYGPGSGTTTHEFNVTVTPVQSSTNQTSSNATPAEAPATSGWPTWLVVSLIILAVLVVAFIIWFIIRRRRNHQAPPPPTVFTPMQ